MCHIYASVPPEAYEPVTRSVRLHGQVTSIRLEARFWEILDGMAARQEMSTPRFVTTLYDEVLELRGEVGNFTSLLRVVCTVRLDRVATAVEPPGLRVVAG
jgi:predicted DNA-binding ribbon-helix-helix protein